MSEVKTGIILSYLTIVVVNVAGLISTPIIVRALGAEQYGLYLVLGSLIAYIALLDLGMTSTITRFVAKYKAQNDIETEQKFFSIIFRVISFIILMMLGLGGILYLNLDTLIQTEILKDNLNIVFALFLFTSIINLITGFLNGYLTAYEKFIFLKTVNLVKCLLRLGIILALFIQIGSIFFLVLIDFVLALAVLLCSLFYFFKVYPHRFNLSYYDSKFLKELYKYAFWVFVLGLISQIQWQTGQILIGYKIDNTAVAIYGLGILLGTYYGAFSTAVSGVFIARTTYKVYQNNSMQELTEYMVKIGRISAIVLMLILVNFVLIGQNFIRLWVGDDYQQAWFVALLIMIVYTVPLLQAIANQVLDAKKLFKFKAKIYLVFLSLGLLLGYFLIDYYSVYGMIIGIAAGWIISLIIMTTYYHNFLKLDMVYFFKKLINIFKVSLITVVIGYFIAENVNGDSWLIFACKAALISMLYFALMYKWGISNEERVFVQRIRGR
ncbi:oligosaccharide flippase family protein [Acinetobacter sp. NS-4]|uniref:lipopolysaccharide biosynthesis protein n=1 Tax=Acinetobacter sp. NS-4 TaxID=3127956 RepID=UPI00307D4A12